MPSMPTLVLRCTAALLLLAHSGAELHAQLTVSNTQSPAALVNSMLLGPGISASNVTFNGVALSTPSDQLGAFQGTNSNIGLTSGIVLSTGRVQMVQGANTDAAMTLSPSAPSSVQDPDLGQYMHQLNCVAVLEFDLVPAGDSISFRFVFGSEEYNEYVCSQFNDVFGLFLSGPGINGTFSNGAVNLGTVPGSISPIMINTVNNGTPGWLGNPSGASCNAYDPNWQANAHLYVDNTGGGTVQLDGFTIPIQVGVRVQCGQTYHIKIAIAHAGDSSLDSAVLIEGGSFSSTSALTTTVTTPMNDGILTEGCAPGQVTITRPGTTGDLTVHLQPTGPGITTDDLDAWPGSVTIPDGAASVSFPIAALRDALAEGLETLTVLMDWTTPCGTPSTSSFQVQLQDHEPITITAMDHHLNCDQDSVQLSAAVAGGLGQLHLQWSTGATGPDIRVSGLDNATYTMTVTDECPEVMVLDVHVTSGCDIVVPNVFTPNGDGVNDTWTIRGLRRSQHTVRVFNRWGQVVFESTNYGNNWRGNGLPDGTYFYEIISDRADGPLSGHLTILGSGQR